MTGTVLILGPTGRFGHAAAEAFWNAGWRVRLFDRKKDDLIAAATGADVIVNGWNPPYQHWARDLLGMTERLVDAMQASGATLIQPANIYVYGAGSGPVLGPDTPHAARNPLGRLRIEMEARLRAAGTPVILLRSGDYIDTAASGNWIDQVMLKPLGRGRIAYPGDPSIEHAWAYLPDLAEAAVALAEIRHELPAWREVLFPGYTLSGHELARLVGQAAGRDIALRRMQWLPIRLLSPVMPMLRGLLEMRYLWNMPHRIDGADFATLLPRLKGTDPETALARQIEGLDRSPEQRNARALGGRPAIKTATSP